MCNIPITLDSDNLDKYTYKELLKEKEAHGIPSRKETEDLIKNITHHYKIFHRREVQRVEVKQEPKN